MSVVLNKKESTVLCVEGLTVDFDVKGKSVNILSEISFDLRSGETLGIIGESGCGKSMTALALLRMIPSPPGRITGGKVLLNEENLHANFHSQHIALYELYFQNYLILL